MGRRMNLFLLSLVLVTTFSFCSAETWKYNYLPVDDPSGNITYYNNYTYNNCTINGSTFNSTQFDSTSEIIIKESWLTSFLNSWFDGKTTDDLIEGSSNLYDNQTWSQALADGLYCKLTGCTMAGDINMDGNNITNIKSTKFTNSSMGIWSNSTHTIFGYIEGL